MDDNQTPDLHSQLIEADPSLLDAVADPPMATADLPPPAPVAAPADPTADGWDPAKHETPPRRNKRGEWAKLRGNAARKAAGLPLIGATAGKTPRPAPEPAPADPAAPAADLNPASRVVLPDDTGAAADPTADGLAVDAVPMDTALTLDDYKTTGTTVARLCFAGGRLGIDADEWAAKPAETEELGAAFARVWHHYGLPRLGPLAELAAVGLVIVGQRSGKPKTGEALGAVRRILSAWMSGLFGGRRMPGAGGTP